MADATTFSFPLQEVAEALIKQQGLSEGKWLVSFEMAFAAGMMGPSGPESRPSALVQINQIQLTRALPEQEAFAVVVDAAAVNPKRRPKGAVD